MEPMLLFRITAFVLLALLFVLEEIASPLPSKWMIVGEYFHCASFLLLAELLIKNKGFKGISVKCQILLFFVHWFRYADCFFVKQNRVSILILKVLYMVASATVLAAIWKLYRTYERKKDTCSTLAILTLAVFLSGITFACTFPSGLSAAGMLHHWLWIFSHYLQGFVMLPQFIFSYRDPENNDALLIAYIIMLSSYRLTYAAKWITTTNPEKNILISGPLGLVLMIVLLSDYILYRIKKQSFISKWLLRIDDKIDSLQQPLLNVVYVRRDPSSRLPQSIDELNDFEINRRNIDGKAYGKSAIDPSDSFSTTTTFDRKSYQRESPPYYQDSSASGYGSDSDKKKSLSPKVENYMNNDISVVDIQDNRYDAPEYEYSNKFLKKPSSKTQSRNISYSFNPIEADP